MCLDCPVNTPSICDLGYDMTKLLNSWRMTNIDKINIDSLYLLLTTPTTHICITKSHVLPQALHAIGYHTAVVP